jgi:hypothetical protein
MWKFLLRPIVWLFNISVTKAFRYLLGTKIGTKILLKIGTKVASNPKAKAIYKGLLTKSLKTKKGREAAQKILESETGLVTSFGGVENFKKALTTGRIVDLEVSSSFFRRMIALTFTVILALGIDEVFEAMFDYFWSDDEPDDKKTAIEKAQNPLNQPSLNTPPSRVVRDFTGDSVVAEMLADGNVGYIAKEFTGNRDFIIDEDRNGELTLDEFETMKDAAAALTAIFGSRQKAIWGVEALQVVRSNPEMLKQFLRNNSI